MKKQYPTFDEVENKDKVSEPAVGYASMRKAAEMSSTSNNPINGYNGFYTEDSEEFDKYKSELIAEAMNDGLGLSWNEVRQQIKDQHPTWLR